MKHNYLTKRCILNRAILVFILIALSLAGCATPATQAPAAGKAVRISAKPRLAALSLEAARVPQLVDGNTNLAFDLYRTLFDPESNLVTAPHSLSVSLAMSYAGARGQTETEMADALHFEMPQSNLHPAFNSLDQVLTQREGSQLCITNALWGSQQSNYLTPFLDTLAENYGAGIRIVDFGDPEQARQTINQWVGKETEDRIPALLPPEAIQGNTDLVLTNAVYFKAGWGQAFNTVQTREGDFTLLDGQNVSIPMMSGIFELPYTQVGDLQAVELPYEGGAFSMLLLLPETGSFEDSIERLDSGLLNTIRMDMRPKAVQVALPKFQLDSAIQMRKPLIDLGMVDAFGEADFSGIDGSQELFIDQVYHQAFISVDEAGTEATGGSAVMMSRKGVPSAEMTFVANHPFIFLIRDVKSGAVLFLGHVINPDL